MPEHFIAETAHINDIPGILEIEELCFDSDRFSKRQFRYLLTKANSAFWVVKSGNRTAAYIILLRHSGSQVLRIYSIAVHPDFRGRGIAGLLLEKAKSDAIENGSKYIGLEVRKDNTTAIKMYENAGFIMHGIKHNYYTDGSDAIKMVKTLE